MGGNDGDDHRLGKIGADAFGRQTRMQFHMLGRARSQRLDFAAGGVIVSDIGKLRENRKSADQQKDIGFAQFPGLPNGQFADAAAVLLHRLAANILDQCVGVGAMLFADNLPQQAPEQADEGAILGVAR